MAVGITSNITGQHSCWIVIVIPWVKTAVGITSNITGQHSCWIVIVIPWGQYGCRDN